MGNAMPTAFSSSLQKVCFVDNIILAWLVLAGPIWALLGGWLVPQWLAESSEVPEDSTYQPNTSSMLAGALGGFTLGPLALGYFWQRRYIPQKYFWIITLLLIFVLIQLIHRINNPDTVSNLWLLLAGPLWAVIGWIVISRRYRQQGLPIESANAIGGLAGFVAGPLLLIPLYFQTPELQHRGWWLALVGSAMAWFYVLFALANPENPCVAMPFAPTYVTQQTINGLTIGTIYALTAVGLTLIYSVQGIVNLAHGQFYMVGGYLSYYSLSAANDVLVNNGYVSEDFTISPLWGIPVAGILTFIGGWLFEIMFLRPMHTGKIERAAEYAILITFGFGFFLEYTTLALVGPFSQRGESYGELRRINFGAVEFDGERQFGPFLILADRAIAGGIGLILIGLLLWYLQRTWSGRALRAVSMHKDAAALTGVNPLRMNTFAFALGSMLAAMSGAALIPVFAWVPWVGGESAIRAYVIVVLGGLGSVPGALLGGLIVGVVEALGSGCYPDPSRGAAYKEAFALLMFAGVLLIRPTGLFGRKE